ncbi:Retrovirus-related Pol polyprotein from transposon TNT 1-94 [Cucumis melo var. makuwa]|uniref:Retrovirus-related Pol polyprotein from transposon TNT 1-94 n=1 Tax=Cucumis melo var. makuwa TaxID=1194695 RepID=A0A5A7V903_CUCMM|nr:Retrovirus-related Pol polyprotein from transposon TNT 1-94 [Cucumis melo var. makuwa]
MIRGGTTQAALWSCLLHLPLTYALAACPDKTIIIIGEAAERLDQRGICDKEGVIETERKSRCEAATREILIIFLPVFLPVRGRKVQWLFLLGLEKVKLWAGCRVSPMLRFQKIEPCLFNRSQGVPKKFKRWIRCEDESKDVLGIDSVALWPPQFKLSVKPLLSKKMELNSTPSEPPNGFASSSFNALAKPTSQTFPFLFANSLVLPSLIRSEGLSETTIEKGNREWNSVNSIFTSGQVRNPYSSSRCKVARLRRRGIRYPLQKALNHPLWKKGYAMIEEIEALKKKETWELITATWALARGKGRVGYGWVYTLKDKAYGSIQRASVVAKGFTQTYGIDYLEAFAPVPNSIKFHVILSVAAKRSWSLHQLDVKNVFLHGDLMVGRSHFLHFSSSGGGRERKKFGYEEDGFLEKEC